MKRIFFVGSLLSICFGLHTVAQTVATPAETQSQTNPRQEQPNGSTIKKGRRNALTPKISSDTTRPKKRKQRRLAPDSLRRGGATRVDTV